MIDEVKEYFDILLVLCKAEETPLVVRYKQMREMLERLCRMQMQDESLQMTDLSARISFLAARVGLTSVEQNRLHTFRLTSNAILNRQTTPTQENLFRDIKTLAFLLRKISGQDIPGTLYTILPKADATYLVSSFAGKQIQRMRVCFQYADDTYLYVVPSDAIIEEPLRVRYNVSQVNEEFAETCKLLWHHAQLNLLDVSIDDKGILTPSFIVLEPDYLIDISSLAECFRDYGHHPANYLLSKLQPIDNARPLLLGNIANLFLDEWIHADTEVDYVACMKKAFRRYSIELAACKDLADKEKERGFFDDCKMHFDHIRRVVTETFHASGYELDKTDAVLEPSYICEALGLQGRLDYMQRDMHSFIEMKSGKADEYSIRNKVEPKENNKVQMLLYQAVLQYSMGMDHRKVRPYLLYTRYPLLYPARSSWAMVKRAIDLRNRIVANEFGVQLHNSTEFTANMLARINPTTLNEKKLKGRFWEQYLSPSIVRFKEKLDCLTSLEQAYYYVLYNFITKEQYTAKSGDVDYEGRTGAASLWLSSLTEKHEAGEILYDLSISENHATNEHKASLTLTIPVNESTYEMEKEVEALPNFRQGDAVVLYERNCDTDNVTNKMVFKGNIESITASEVKFRLRAAQRNPSVLPSDSLYAMEHDIMDTGFHSMYLGLSAFTSANKERRDLILSQRQPEFDLAYDEAISKAPDDFSRVVLKAQAAKDYFLLIGPPGTGKTSRALRLMVEAFYRGPCAQILLLAYTNRAVDEICKALSTITQQIDFIRIGSELACGPAYRKHLIENELSLCNRRSEVVQRITSCRIFVGTVASVANKPELFQLKSFDVAIVDEATQILEPQLLGILCARKEDGTDAVGKFILIGDHKQLPAVVQQSSVHSQVHDESLLAIGLKNLKDSLFERLYRTVSGGRATIDLSADPDLNVVNAKAFDQLCRQGRMNPAIARFSNEMFYGGKLESVGLAHQIDELVASPLLIQDELSPLMTQRMVYLPSVPDIEGFSCKVNHSEACLCAQLAVKVYEQYNSEFNSDCTLGIITPYRSQIALIKKEIRRLGIPALNDVLIDTVERFQGSERDVVIYSFCVNHAYQLHFLSNMIEEGGVLIDRKLNVALTRARKQMFIIGVPELLHLNPIYHKLLNFITTKAAFTKIRRY
ncbi:AAA domain-containing protein [uncultured Bacteroides sp.]|uniref:AAA domain-containing protein n=1 Tax=uncultured Bacteroides sp. TaxID=162156 RepID=UPI002AA8E2E0|nr:AAA domain-containing protein [uncultured Bacteroides sp.]